MFAAQQTLAFFPTYVWVFDLPEDEARHLNETILGRLVAGGLGRTRTRRAFPADPDRPAKPGRIPEAQRIRFERRHRDLGFSEDRV